MKKNTIMQLIIIGVLIIILGILLKITFDAIDQSTVPQMDKPNREMQGQMEYFVMEVVPQQIILLMMEPT